MLVEIFFAYAPDWLIASYVAAALMTVAYSCWKLAARRYLFSPYTVVIYTFAFALLVVAPFQYNDQAWQVLSSTLTAAPFYSYLDLSIGVNSLGFVLAMATLWFVEARAGAPPSPPFISKPPLVAITTVSTALVGGIVVFAICIAAAGTIPLFGGRTVFNTIEAIRPIYNFANYLILFTTSVLVVWSFISRSRRYVLLITAGLVCMLFTGGRTSFLSVVQLILFMWLYQRYRHNSLKATSLLLIWLGLVAVAGLFLASLRSGGEFVLARSLDVVLYGNTFSDLRDGAFVAQAWTVQMGGDSLAGNTYLAGLMSFIPSSLSDFRETWSWGYFTTIGLFAWEDHYGFRGGWSLEAFMNFGVAGVIAFALVCGWLLGRLERMFYQGVVAQSSAWYPNAYLWSWVGYGVFTVLIASSATYNLYSLLIVIALLRFLTMLRRGMHRSLGVDVRGHIDLTAPMMGYERR